MKHILIVGGTGMLRGATEYFIQQGNIVTLMARNERREQRKIAELFGTI